MPQQITIAGEATPKQTGEAGAPLSFGKPQTRGLSVVSGSETQLAIASTWPDRD